MTTITRWAVRTRVDGIEGWVKKATLRPWTAQKPTKQLRYARVFLREADAAAAARSYSDAEVVPVTVTFPK